jgi:DNA-binding transcriptional LysR family regulator
VPLVPDFLNLYPEVDLDLALNDGIIDIVGERADIAIRSGALRDSSLKARKLLESRRIIVASPDYLKREGIPETPDDLERHNCLTFSFHAAAAEWPFRDPQSGDRFARPIFGNFETNNGPTARSLCLAGLGIARVGQFHVQPDIDAGTLLPVLEAYNPEDIELIHAVYPSHEHLAARIRAFIDFLVSNIR